MKNILKNTLLVALAAICMSGCRFISSDDDTKGDKGPKGSDGLPGKDGEDGKTPYEQYVELHPEYTEDEEQWYQDLANGKLSDDYSIMDDFMMVATIDGEYVVGGYLGIETEITIPDTYKGKPIIGIGYAAFTEQPIEKVTFGKNIVTIGRAAFESCEELSEVMFNGGLVSVGQNAFYGNVSLTSVSFPNTLRSIEAHAFQESGLTGELALPDALNFIGAMAFESSKIEGIAFGTGELKIASGAFSTSALSGDLRIPGNVKLVGDQIFSNTNITSAEFVDSDGSNVGSSHTFYYCASLTSLVIPEGCKSIPNLFCFGCSSLTDLSLPSTVTEIGQSAFYGTGFDSIAIPAGVKKIGQQAFRRSKLASVSLPEGLEAIDYAAFSETKLAEVTLPSTITYIGSNAFQSCGNLVKVAYAAPLKGNLVIDRDAFSRCINLKDFEIPNGVIYLGSSACFQAAGSSLAGYSGITIPGTLKVIQTSTFTNVAINGDINIEDGVKIIESRSFYQLSCAQPSTINVYIPASVEIIGAAAFTTKDSSCQMNMYCAAPSKPSGWATDWCATSSWINVTWGYQG